MFETDRIAIRDERGANVLAANTGLRRPRCRRWFDSLRRCLSFAVVMLAVADGARISCAQRPAASASRPAAIQVDRTMLTRTPERSPWLRLMAVESDGPPIVNLLPPTDDSGAPIGYRWPENPALRFGANSGAPQRPRSLDVSEESVTHENAPSLAPLHDNPLDELTSEPHSRVRGEWWEELLSDQKNFYSRQSLSYMAIAFAGGAVMANTSIDAHLHDFFQENVRNANSDEWSEALHLNKEIGNGLYTLPLFGVTTITGRVFDDVEPVRVVGEWGERSLRTFVVGAPPLVATQLLTGGSRPNELSKIEHNSHWHPFQDNNGVSGHAFMGAIPFLSAAKMVENPWIRSGFYVASTLPGLSRMNDGAHYPSQVLLGWWLAFLAAEAVDGTFDDSGIARRGWHMVPLPVSNGSGIGLERRW